MRAHKPRYCLTIWLDSPLANNDACALPWPGMAQHLDGGLAAYANPTMQRRLARAVYADEYEVGGRNLLGAWIGLIRLVRRGAKERDL